MIEPIRITLVVLLILVEVIAIAWLKSIDVHFYLKDYTVAYKDQLDTIFGDDYVIGPRQTVSKYNVSVVNGAKSYDYYYVWEITYKDSFGDEYTVELVNKDPDLYSIKSQAAGWMNLQAEKHFAKTYENSDYNEYIYYESLRYAFSQDEEVNVRIREFNSLHSAPLKAVNGFPHLYDIDYKKWFTMRFSYYYVSIYESDISDEMVQHILDSFLKETDGRFNLRIEILPEKNSDKTTEYIYYFWGKPQELDKYDNYELALFYEYEKLGMFD